MTRRRLGVIGTMVWDTIHGRDPHRGPVEEWGGIAYALATLEVTLPHHWEIVPLIKVGRDMAGRANGFLSSLTRRSAAARFVEVPQANNHVVLRYESESRRAERLSGGVPPWRWEELGPMVADLDALYVNFISGFEMDLATAECLRRGFAGPMYADLHSLFLGIGGDGSRFPRPLEHPAAWFSCFDLVQLNEDEFAMLGEDPLRIAADALAAGVRLLVVTLGDQGAIYFTSPEFDLFERSGQPGSPLRTARVPTEAVAGSTDPTGCGDVFGATLIALLLDRVDIEAAIRRANAMARRNLTHKGATNLQYHLRGEIAPR